MSLEELSDIQAYMLNWCKSQLQKSGHPITVLLGFVIITLCLHFLTKYRLPIQIYSIENSRDYK